MILFRIFLIIVIAALNVSAGSVERCTYPSECTFVVTSSDDQSVLDSIESELIGDVTKFRQELADSVDYWLIANLKNDFCMASPCDTQTQYKAEDLIIVDKYEFEFEPHLAILRYTAPEMNDYFIGFVKSNDLWFPLSDIYGNEIEANFNKIIELCPGLRKSPLICKSAILLGLKYRIFHTCVLYNEKDIVGVNAYGWDKSKRPPDSLRYSRPLYILDICKNSTLNQYFDNEIFQRYNEKLNEANDSFPIIPPIIKYGATMDTVLLTVYNDHYGEIAEWQLIYNNNGYVVSMDFMKEPLITNWRDTPIPSGCLARQRKYGPAEWKWE